MINEQDILNIISEKVTGIDIQNIKSDTKFSDLGIDSLDHAVILLTLDEQFNLKIPDSEVENCNSIDAIIEFASRSNYS